MEKLLNNKKSNNLMKAIISLLTLLVLLPLAFADGVPPNSSSPEDGHELNIVYNFETGSGSVVIDLSGNNNNGIITGATFDATEAKDGSFGMDFDGNNDWVDGSTGLVVGAHITTAMWVKPDPGNVGSKVFFQIDDTSGSPEHFHFYYDFTAEDLLFGYKNASGNHHIITLENFVLPEDGNTWTHFVVGVDVDTQQLHYYRNGTYIGNFSLGNGGYSQSNSTKAFRLGADLAGASDYNGGMDSFRLMNFIPSQSQVDEIIAGSLPTLVPAPTGGSGGGATNVTGAVVTNIITSHTPTNGDTLMNPIEFTANTNIIADCDLYIDNSLVEQFSSIVGFSHFESLSIGLHDYFVYCSYIDNSTIFYEITNTTSFTVEEGLPSQIDFIFSSTEFTISSTPLFMVTPCLKPSILPAWMGSDPYSQASTGDVYFSPLVNGKSTFNLSGGTHEFCMVHGYGQYNTDAGFSDVWFVQKAWKQLDIGEYSIPSNVTKVFNIELEEEDIYEISNPRWWGTSWSALGATLMGLLVGVALIGAGIVMKMPQAIVIGGIVMAVALGFSIPSIVLGVIS